jgi:4,5-DOPA dioxygenase extradiol
MTDSSLSAPSPTVMPAAFIGHGSPMNALERNQYTQSWRALGASVPRPRAILVISAHWYINATAVTAMLRPRTIHDFYGFPRQLFDVRYDVPGLPQLAEEISDVVAPTAVGLDVDSWGIDHGTWSVLVHAFPDADIPVVQLSINESKPLAYHLELGAKLAPLRESGVLIIGSGNVVHNLGGMHPRLLEEGFDWAQRFNEAAREIVLEDPAETVRLSDHPDFGSAAPTAEHFIPLLYLAGLASAGSAATDVLVDGYAYGSLSMASYVLDATPRRPQPLGDPDSPALPDIDPAQTNL